MLLYQHHLSHVLFNFLLDLESDLHPLYLRKVFQLLESYLVHTFNIDKSCKKFKGKISERTVLEDRADEKNLLRNFRFFQHELLLVEKINDIAKGIDASPPSDNQDSSWIGMHKLQSLPLFLAQDNRVDISFDKSLGQFALGVGFK